MFDRLKVCKLSGTVARDPHGGEIPRRAAPTHSYPHQIGREVPRSRWSLGTDTLRRVSG